MWHLDRRRRRVTLSNLELAFGDELQPSERARIGRAYYRHMGSMGIETVAVEAQLVRRPASSWFEIENLERARELLEEHGAVIGVSCHSGPWELMGAALCEVFAPLHVVFRPLSNPYLDRRLARLREQTGIGLIRYDDRVVARMLRLLRSGQSVGMLCDFNQRRNPLLVDFFGVPAPTAGAPGILAARLRLPVLPIFAHRVAPYRYRLRFEAPILPADLPESNAVEYVTREVNRSIERFVRAHPDQWHWNYRRWRSREARGARRERPRAAAEVAPSGQEPPLVRPRPLPQEPPRTAADPA